MWASEHGNYSIASVVTLAIWRPAIDMKFSFIAKLGHGVAFSCAVLGISFITKQAFIER